MVFNFPAGTSRGVLTEKDAYFIHALDSAGNEGIGECSIIPGLSFDDRPDYLDKLLHLIKNYITITDFYQEFKQYPSIIFGIEMALLDLKNGGRKIFFLSPFTEGRYQIPINGLIWMGEESFMIQQIEEKVKSGFTCLKMKIGAIDWVKEYTILENIRKKFSKNQLELRVDANGAFDYEQGIQVCALLGDLQVHSIEQPIKTDNFGLYRFFCEEAKTPVALDEQLIGLVELKDKERMLQEIKPPYIVLKPSLHGGFKGCAEWISLAEKNNIKWWITSALESNIGLNAIAQWTATLKSNMYQGLGTGQIYANNFEAPLTIDKGHLVYQTQQ
jgi:O-succinylbenzoate synthase